MSDDATSCAGGWEGRFTALLPLFGHRNWIVIADAAYPAQAKAGIETIATGAGQVDVMRKVMNAIAASSHIRANVYMDHELVFVSEQDAPGVSSYRREVEILFTESTVTRIPHEEIIRKLDQSAQVFRIVILKTRMTIPYTSVFFELDCDYWNADAEQKLRKAMDNLKD